jgi:hypothetical protein
MIHILEIDILDIINILQPDALLGLSFSQQCCIIRFCTGTQHTVKFKYKMAELIQNLVRTRVPGLGELE